METFEKKIFTMLTKQVAADDVKDEIEHLINGGSVRKKIRQELTYRDIDSDIDNLWSILFTTGYLTQDGEGEEEDGIKTIYKFGIACYKKRCKVEIALR